MPKLNRIIIGLGRDGYAERTSVPSGDVAGICERAHPLGFRGPGRFNAVTAEVGGEHWPELALALSVATSGQVKPGEQEDDDWSKPSI